MAVIYSQATQKFLQEVTQLSKVTHYASDAHKRTAVQLRGTRRLYEANTSKFEPTVENREHLIKTLMPMVIKLAKATAALFGGRIEYNDCISAGNQGAIIATDIYIRKSLIETQPAKLSTYAHSYITKYINEYCYSVNSILSHGPTKWQNASSERVMSGNQTYNEEGRSVEFFDIANDSHLMITDKTDSITENVDDVSSILFKKLTVFDKEVIFLSFGIGSKDSNTMTPQQIAKSLGCTLAKVNASLSDSLEVMKHSIDSSQITEVIRTLRSTDLSLSTQWQRSNK